MATKDYASPAQARLMRAVAHGWKPKNPRGELPPRGVAQEFVQKKDRKKMAFGGLARMIQQRIQQQRAQQAQQQAQAPQVPLRQLAQPGGLEAIRQQYIQGPPPAAPPTVRPGGPGGPLPGRQMIGAEMQGGPRVPPSLRGYLQKMRMQARQQQGGNRVGQSDQQGALSRALQRGTGRPPMSRRSAFPGR